MVMTTSEQIGKGMKAISEHRFSLAADLAQSQDFTALCCVEAIKTFHVEYGGKEKLVKETFAVRHLQRFPKHLSYVEQVARIAIMLERPPLSQGCTFLIDETGVGRPVGDLFDANGLHPVRVTIVAGENQVQKGARRWHVAKQILISGLDARLHTEELKIAEALADGDAFRNEMREFKRHVSDAGRVQLSARIGQTDDLILATSIALWAHTGRIKPPPARIGRARFIPTSRIRSL